jgi:hypothetical protein
MEDRMNIQYRRPDGSFIATINGLPYHVTASDPLFAQAQTAGAGKPFEPVPTAAELLAAERAAMNPFYTAFRFAMKQTPAATHPHLLARVTQTVAAARAQDPFSDLVIWADSVTQIVRTHPDMTAFATLFDLTPEALDDLCRLAMQIEAGA